MPCPYALFVLQVWTFTDRVAFVLSVTEHGQPVQDGMKLQRLRQLLLQMMDEQGTGIVSIKKVGAVCPLIGDQLLAGQVGVVCAGAGVENLAGQSCWHR